MYKSIILVDEGYRWLVKVVQIINEVGINDKCGGYLRLIPLVLLLVPPTLLLVPPGGTSVFQCVLFNNAWFGFVMN